MPELSEKLLKTALRNQQAEVTGAIVYDRMAQREKNTANAAILRRMASDERRHAVIWQHYTGREVAAKRRQILWYGILGWLLGYTFVIKIMERDEDLTAREYADLEAEIPEMADIRREEEEHERQLQDMLDEERLRYVGAMVLGLNDALVELTGTIAGLTLALADTRLVALAGIITGVSATLSMAASNYLAERADGKEDAFKSCVYTGIAYLITVVLLVLPYVLFPGDMYLAALGCMLLTVVLIILAFNYYISVAKSLPFKQRFVEMASISLGVAVVSFGIGLLAKHFLDVDV